MKTTQQTKRSKYALKNNNNEYFVNEVQWDKNPESLVLRTKSYFKWLAPRIGLILSNCTFVKIN